MIFALLAAVAVAAGPVEATAGGLVPTPTSTATPTAAPTPVSTATATATPTATPNATPNASPAATPQAPTASRAAPEEHLAAEGRPADDPSLPAAPLGPPLADSGPVLLSRVDRPGGHALERLIEPSGEIVEHEVNAAGTVQSCTPVGRIQALRVVAQQPAAGGEVIEVARDASGALVQVVVAADGEPRAVALLAPPP